MGRSRIVAGDLSSDSYRHKPRRTARKLGQFAPIIMRWRCITGCGLQRAGEVAGEFAPAAVLVGNALAFYVVAGICIVS